MQAAAAEVAKELAAQERREIGLQEKRKHAAGRAKKLKKSVQEVISSPFPHLSLTKHIHRILLPERTLSILSRTAVPRLKKRK